METRSAQLPVKTEKRDGDVKAITGYGAIYYSQTDPGTEYAIWDDMFERMMPGAFDRVLRDRQDVRCLYNHNPSQLLGRTLSSTLTLSVDQKGLRYDCNLPSTADGAKVFEAAQRGDLSGASISFDMVRATWLEEVRSGKTVWVRQIEEVGIMYDVGPVTFPAYEATSVNTRNAGERLKAERDAFILERNKHGLQDDEVAVRLRLLELDDVAP